MGNAYDLPLTVARRKAAELRELVAQGINPLGAPEAPKHGAGKGTTFGQVFDHYYSANAPCWKNPKHRQQWQNSIGTHAKALIGLPVAEISTADVLACLTPIWTEKRETARRVRGRVEMVLDFATAHGHREPGPNPASMSVIRHGLPKTKQIKKHFAAVAVEDAPAIFQAIWERRNEGAGARALAFQVLGAFRPGEVRGLRWSEVYDDRIEIPGERMKAGRRHRVPVTSPMRELLTGERLSEIVFFGSEGKPLSDNTLNAVHKRMGIDATTHGWRSTFMPGAAVMGALSALSALAANRFFARWERETGLNLYGAVTAPTGAGKDSILQLVEDVGQIVDMTVTTSVTSGAALHQAMIDGEGKLALIVDEWAKMLTAKKKDKSANGETAESLLMTLQGRALRQIGAKGYARRGDNKPAVPFPYLTFLGVATGEALDRMLTQDMVADGSINRMLILDAGQGCGKRWPVGHKRPREFPALDGLTDSFSAARHLEHPLGRKVAFKQRMKDAEGHWQTPERVMIAIDLPEAHWHRVRDELERLEQELGPLHELAARFERNAVIVAALLRMGDYIAPMDDDGPLTVTDTQMDWAIRFMRQTVLELAQRFRLRVIDDETAKVMADARANLIG